MTNGETHELHYVEIAGNSGVLVKAVATFRGGGRIKCRFDERGVIRNLPSSACWNRVKNANDALDEQLVSAFALEVLVPKDDGGIVVVQRGTHNVYRAGTSRALSGELMGYVFPPCDISYHCRSDEHRHIFGLDSMAVWTTPMGHGREGVNRVDVWRVSANGHTDLICLYLITDDDGKQGSWKIIDQVRWTGRIYRRKATLPPYTLRSTGKRERDFYQKNPDVRKIMDTHVFVPGQDAENFEARMQILADKRFANLLPRLELDEWHGAEDFWLQATSNVQLADDQAVVKFHSWGVGDGSFGIVEKSDGTALQFDRKAIPPEYREQLLDDKGHFYIPPGTVVTIVGEPVSKVAGREWTPPKVVRMIPLLTPVSVDRARPSKAA